MLTVAGAIATEGGGQWRSPLADPGPKRIQKPGTLSFDAPFA
ncbi:hypothetical protein [Phormidium sp. CCY1219]|nr:hypothetical protein [Phormidium sp. CCY1219]